MELDAGSDPRTIPEWIAGLATAHADNTCVASDRAAITYGELARLSAERGRGLLASGVGKGSRIGLLFGNGVEWVSWWAAISRTGALCIPMSTFLRPAELQRVVRHADLSMLIAIRHFLRRDFQGVIAEALPSLAGSDTELVLPEAPYLRRIVMDDADAPWALSSEWLVGAGRDAVWEPVLAAAEREVHSHDEAICIYTSGQSADPKGVVHTHATVVGKARYFRDMFRFDTGTQTKVNMPFFWVGGLVMSLLPTMDAGGTALCTEQSTWGSADTIDSVESPADVWRPYSGYRKLPALGMTETFGMYSWAEEFPIAEYPIAPPIDLLEPGYDLLLVDEQGSEVPIGTPGEIVVRGPTLARRLQKVDPKEVFTPAGYYRTGDRGIRLGNRVCFLGRIGDMIKTSGANVSPAEVEGELRAISAVTAAHVVGLDDGPRNQVVGAAVVLRPESSLTAADILNVLRQRLSSYKVPKTLVIFDSVDEIPMTPSIKVNRRELARFIADRQKNDRAGDTG